MGGRSPDVAETVAGCSRFPWRTSISHALQSQKCTLNSIGRRMNVPLDRDAGVIRNSHNRERIYTRFPQSR